MVFNKVGCTAILVVLIAAGSLVVGISFGISLAILAGTLYLLRKKIKQPTKNQKWLLAILSVLAVVPGSPLIAGLVSSIIAACFLYPETSPNIVYASGFACLAVFTGMSVLIPTDAFADGGLTNILTSIQNLSADVKTIAPTVGYAAGLGFGGTGLVEIVKSKNGQGGDLGSGIKKLLVGGGLAGITAVLDMSKTDIAGK